MADALADLRSGELLPVLQRASHEQLAEIVDALAESWTARVKQDARYKQAAKDLTQIPDVIAEHVRRAGGHAFANLWRGSGPAYPQVLRSLCRKMKVTVPKDSDVVTLEQHLLTEIMERVLRTMSSEDQERLKRDAEEMLRQIGARFAETPDSKAWMAAAAAAALLPLAAIGPALAGGFAGSASRFRAANPAALIAMGAILAVVAVIGALGPSYHGLSQAVFKIAALRLTLIWGHESQEAEP